MQPVLANILQPLIDVFEEVLVFFHDTVGLGWGMSIIALTISIRALLLPLTLKQVKSMQGLQRIAPHMKEVQKKYKDDKQRQNQEMMKLYQEHKVNPFASCLPLLAQLPVFISLFYLLQDDLRVDICGQSERPCGESPASNFLFIPDITDNATGLVLIALIVMYVSSQLFSTLLMSVSADKNQRYLFAALPFIFIPFVINFPRACSSTGSPRTSGRSCSSSWSRRRSGRSCRWAARTARRTTTTRRRSRRSAAAARQRRRGQRERRAPAQAVPEPHAGSSGRGQPAVLRPAPAAVQAQEEAVGAPPLMAEKTAPDALRELLELIAGALALDAEVVIEDGDEALVGRLDGEDLGLFIGHHGQTIEAVQHLAQRVVGEVEHKRGADRRRVVVDAAGYRERRELVLQRQADEAAESALASGRPVALDEMTASERRVVHEYLRDRGDVETHSEGEEPHRHLVVSPLSS
jgi:YidC/Oxa1 family membrane protein insertase